MTDFTPCERTIRMCLDALPEWKYQGGEREHGWNEAIRDATVSLRKLLPKPDPAKALINEWDNQGSKTWSGEREIEAFAKWLVDSGMVTK